MSSEEAQFAAAVQDIEKWWTKPRFQFTKRPYGADKVAAFRGTLTPELASNHTAMKLYDIMRTRFQQRSYVHTFGALDPVQVVQMAPHLECVYVSGWQCSSTASTSNEPGPDFADYPANTVPNKVDQLFRAQLMHDRRQNEERARMSPEERAKTPKVDYLRPIIADGDTGFGGITSVMKLMKMQIEAGAAAVHIEDQLPGAKKCGHMGGKVLVPVREHFDRMAAARLQADIMGTETVLIARTDAESATFLSNNIDPRDHPYISGSTNPSIGTLEDATDKESWMANSNCMRYSEAVAAAMKKAGKENLIKDWMAKSMKMANKDARALAKQLGFGDVFWCWDAPRSREGYFAVKGGIDYAVMRAIAYADVSDCVWCETATPSVHEMEEFAGGCHAEKPNLMLSYNLSPSFNWDAAGMKDNDIQAFQAALGRLGICYHFITLAGFHSNALIIDQLAKAYAGPKGVLAYVQMVQREERRLNVSTLTHQKWSGAELCDNMMLTATGGGASTASLKGATEAQFQSKL
mmetsp:Transcript_1499/g.4669  ORF Transcript_1499/g.4669 Transcript_1499/m.4669 type:complete len:521 (-) Transcript_1499:76-1638(-)